jgi:hypothetical protein
MGWSLYSCVSVVAVVWVFETAWIKRGAKWEHRNIIKRNGQNQGCGWKKIRGSNHESHNKLGDTWSHAYIMTLFREHIYLFFAIIACTLYFYFLSSGTINCKNPTY